MELGPETQDNSRPYRSHKIPACNACRKRKIRCEIDGSGNNPCRFCRDSETECEISRTKHQAKDAALLRVRRRAPSKVVDAVRQTTGVNPDGIPKGREHFTSPKECDTMIANPTMSEDIVTLESYITSQTSGSVWSATRYSRVSKAPNESILYLPAPQRRATLSSAKATPGREQREILDQVFGSIAEEVIQLYFRQVHSCLPIVDEATFWDLWQKDRNRISPTLICNMLAIALPYWNASEALGRRHRPDSAFAWNQAGDALRDDFSAPSITTVHSTLLSLSGRPCLEMRGNLLNLGRTVSLAHSLGLHRDPTNWQILDAEKNLRIKLWWAVLIHDYWSSLTHGTPALVHKENFDVPLPMKEAPGNSASIFIQLCSLTQVLGNILPLMYTLKPDSGDMWRAIRRIECSLDDIEVHLQDELQHGSPSGESINGRSNLLLFFLALKLALNRVAFRALATDRTTIEESNDYRLAMLRESALKLLEFVTSLTGANFRGFWLPYTCHILVIATTVLLRCIAETTSHRTRRECAESLSKLMNHLDAARRDFEWELGDLCVERYRGVVQAVTDSLPSSSTEANVASDTDPHPSNYPSDGILNPDGAALETALPLDIDLHMGWFDEPWESLWLDGLLQPTNWT